MSLVEFLTRGRALLTQLYGPEKGEGTLQAVLQLLERWRPRLSPPFPRAELFPQGEAFLIAYGDHVLPKEANAPRLQGLRRFLETFTQPHVRGLHLLPFFPYSSDDGFAIIDYTQVRVDLGTWQHVEDLARSFTLMVDLVLNHVSSQNPWFQAFLQGDPNYQDFFLVVDEPQDPAWQHVVRPRTTPLFTSVETARGRRWVWTTFSPDQVDLNYRNPQVLLHMLDVMLTYIAHGAQVIRLDAVAYTWKEAHTSCIHLPQAHALVQLLRAVVDAVAPWVRLLTETNVPHEQNIAYFGDGTNEAHMVYNFTLPPLVLHAFLTQDATTLARWAATLHPPGEKTAFLNFLASHDGIGVTPAHGWLEPEALEALYRRVREHGGYLSFKTGAHGERQVYEFNITWYDALNHPQYPTPWDVPRFLASQAVMLSLQGVPAIYLSSLFGARNCHRCVQKQGYPRAINREKFPWAWLSQVLTRESTHYRQVLQGYQRLLEVWRRTPGFHPQAPQEVLATPSGALALLRHHPTHPVLALISVQHQGQQLVFTQLPGSWEDLLSGQVLEPAQGIPLAPYQVRWLQPQNRFPQMLSSTARGPARARHPSGGKR